MQTLLPHVAQAHPLSALVNLSLTICLHSLSHFLTPSCLSRNPGDYQGRGNAISYKEPKKTNDGLQLLLAFV